MKRRVLTIRQAVGVGILVGISLGSLAALPMDSTFTHAAQTVIKPDSLFQPASISTNANEDSVAQAEADSSSVIQVSALPFVMRTPTQAQIKTFQALVLKAVVAVDKRDFSKARKAILKAEPTERLAQVYKAVLLANAYNGEKDFVHADSVLAGALKWVGGSVWQSYLFNFRIKIFPLTMPTDSAKMKFYSQVIQASISSGVKVNFLYDQLELQGFKGSVTGFEEWIKRIVQLAPADRRLDSLYQKLAPSILPGQGNWELQNLLLDLESKLGLYTQAIARSEAMLKLVPGKAEKQMLHGYFANFHFRAKDYRNAIATYLKYIENYGDTPEALLQIARCYDRLQEPKKALVWYDRYLEKFPKQDKTSEIYWLRAWELESQGNYVEATEFYYRQLADFSGNKRGDWANFRVGLCQFKAGNMGAALQAFRAVRTQVNSNAFSAALFWEARSQEATGDSVGAKNTWMELSEKYPFHFYGHLAHQLLASRGAGPDTLDVSRHFAQSTAEGIASWMKQEMSGYRQRLDHDYESAYLGMGKLLQFKLDTLALLTLQTFPEKIKANPWLLYVYARKFQDRQLWRESYRLGLQLSYKIAPDRWGFAPKEVLRLIFPQPYDRFVQRYAAQKRVEPAFVYALMRQESGFDREIKSGVGAVGLMQMMPATGKSIAMREGLKEFNPYSLVDADINIKLGIAYLKELQGEYQQNPYFVLANYNAGPEATKRWQSAANGKSLELVVEDISYWETRDYVKKVMGNYWTYDILWGHQRSQGIKKSVP